MKKTMTTTLSNPLNNLAEYSPMSLDEEAALSRRIHKGDTAAFDELVKRNLRLVTKIVSKMDTHDASFEDAISMGRIALLKAARKYRPGKGAKFSTYAAYWIKSVVARYVTRYRHPVSIPKTVPLLQYKVQRRFEIAANEDRLESDEQVAKDMRHNVEIIRWMKYRYQFVPLQEMEEHGVELVDETTLEDSVIPRDEEGELTQLVMRSDCLSDFERVVIVFHYGLNGNDPLSFADIARLVGRSKERVRQVEEKALFKLKERLV